MAPVVLTIGHSNHDAEAFVRLLSAHAIEVLTDVRSQPFSRFAPHFDMAPLRQLVLERRLKYVFLGKELGGRPSDPSLYDSEGHVLYGRVAETAAFRTGIERVKKGITQYRVALMCSEEDPTECHRRLLVARVLGADGVNVEHIRGNARKQSEAEVAAAERARRPANALLFGQPEETTWRSTRSVSPRSPRASSSPRSSELAFEDS